MPDLLPSSPSIDRLRAILHTLDFLRPESGVTRARGIANLRDKYFRSGRELRYVGESPELTVERMARVSSAETPSDPSHPASEAAGACITSLYTLYVITTPFGLEDTSPVKLRLDHCYGVQYFIHIVHLVSRVDELYRLYRWCTPQGRRRVSNYRVYALCS
jgi:hypothetical protein